MNLKLCLYEDTAFRQFFPLTHTRPVFMLRPGITPLYQKIGRHFPNPDLCLAVRDQVAPLLVERVSDIPVNIVKRQERQDVLFLNGRIRHFGDIVRLVSDARLSMYLKGPDGVAGLYLKAEEIGDIPAITTPNEYVDFAQSAEIADFDTTASMYSHCWDLMADIGRCIKEDFDLIYPDLPPPQHVRVESGSYIVENHQVYLGEGVNMAPTAVIEAVDGPVFIGDNTRLGPGAIVKGPCYIGPNCIVARGVTGGSSIGHTCRLGGEVEESIFCDYVNKHHEGFIGHSVVGAWVNFGAMTTNSDLKNNYSNIRVTLNGQRVDTGSIKVGSFIGDHTKFGIGTLLTTGVNIGACCNIFGGTLIFDKEVPSFSWGSSGHFVDHDFDKAIDTSAKVMRRRDVQLSENEINALRVVAHNEVTDAGALPF